MRVAETGWSKAYRMRDGEVRTRVAAVVDENPVSALYVGAESNIVRGED